MDGSGRRNVTIARSLDAILAELEPGYAGSRKAVQTQIEALPAQYEADLGGLNAQLDQANQNIVDQARRRGLGFSGIPVGEQAQYAATNFAPAVARLKSDQLTRRTSLDEALNSLDRDQRQQALGIRSNEETLDEQRRQFDANMAFQREMADRQAAAARASAAGSYSFGGGGGGATAAPQSNPVPQIAQRGDGGFSFTDAGGRAISAARYAEMTGTNFFDLLGRMAASGDKGASAYLKAGGNVGQSLVRALTWR